ncbi:expressed unknown protein [Seminavis robusta]|uniref:Uncharacterized protein n=1 Tax=Seminavis robusta TaxID=568900 RepID=A0A9N8DFM8_9STRA|nr:expressed unknown protein [Seminavis robusta]|eukprot:Sro66_g037050.1 n/a (365) ;mRNA; f:7402-8496
MMKLWFSSVVIIATAFLPTRSAFLALRHDVIASQRTCRQIGFNPSNPPTKAVFTTGTGVLCSTAVPQRLFVRFSKGRDDEETDQGSSKNSNNSPDYKDRLAKLDQTIAEAAEERKRLLKAELDRMDKSTVKKREAKEDSLVKDEGLVPVDEWTARELRQPPPPYTEPVFQKRTSSPSRISTRSRVSRSDAGTLVIEVTPEGISTGTLFNGAFSVAWFSAIVPATLAAVSGGALGMALFMVPFWAAGGMVAKQAVVDPFISNTVTIGQYAWSLEQRYGDGSKRQGAAIQKQEGATADLQGAKVECPLIVNNVPQYQLNLYSNGYNGGVVSLGVGLPEEELLKVADEINNYLESVASEEGDEAALR